MIRSHMAQKSKQALSVARLKEIARRVMSLSSAKQLTPLDYTQQHRLDKPAVTSFSSIVTQCRNLEKESDFLALYLPLKRSVFNFGMEFKAARVKGEEATDDDNVKLAEWLDEMVSITFEPVVVAGETEPVQVELVLTNLEMLQKFAEDCWNDYFLLDHCVASWLDKQGFASTLPIERTQFTDLLGIPIMRYTHGLSAQDVLKLPTELQDRYKNKASVVLSPQYGEHFKVLKRAREGSGYGVPRLYSIFNLLTEVISKQEGMHAMAFAMRKVTRVHKLGHDITGGDRAGKPLHFWNKTRATAVMRDWDGKVGFTDYTCNFDQETVFPWPDLKVFDELAFKASNMRLNNWGGPVMQMLQAKGVMPYLPGMIRAEATEDRKKMNQFLSVVINAAWQPPVPITLQWSDMIFNESRLAAEMIKFGIQAGIVSGESAREHIGLNNSVENARKLAEANDPDAQKKLTPMWDVSHGIMPAKGETASTLKAQKPPAANGRPPGSPNNA
jgi:hypothetical protein